MFQFFLAPPEGCPLPRWYFKQFSDVYDAFSQVANGLPANIHLLPLYGSDQFAYELDGRHFKSPNGKDYLDHLFNHTELGMVRVSQDSEDRFGSSENRLAVVEGRVDLVRRDLVRSEQRVNVVVARAAEEADGILNEK